MSGVVLLYVNDKLNRDCNLNCIGSRFVLVQVMLEVLNILVAALSIFLGLLKLAI